MKRTYLVSAGAIVTLIICISMWLFLELNEKETTIYSEDYNESSFRQISKGMRNKEVVILLGYPLSIHTITETDDRGERLEGSHVIEAYVKSAIEQKEAKRNYSLAYEYWSYSKQSTTTSDYYVRIIKYDNKGLVTDIIAEIYHD